jgi:hypothetical protein
MLLAPIIGTTQALDRILRTPPSLPPQGADEARSDSKARPWSPYEDQRPFAAIHRLGASDWHSTAGFVGNSRTKAQCSRRWTRGLDPHIDRAKWAADGDAQLPTLVRICGDKCWSKISAQIGNRCDLQCRSRYRQIARDDMFPAGEFRRKNGVAECEEALPATHSDRPCLPPIAMLMAPLGGGAKAVLDALMLSILHQPARP